MPAFKDLTGMTFGHLTVLGRAPSEKGKPTKWFVQCDCENHTIKSVDGTSLTRGLTTSCGCVARQRAASRLAISARKHGMFGTPIYSIWFNTKSKCTKPSHHDYLSFGAKGIKICSEWMEFLPFYEWANSTGYEDGMHLIRFNPMGDFTPDNCTWAYDRKKVSSNSPNLSKLIIYKDEMHSVSEWSRITGIGSSTILARLNKGVPPEIALFQKPGETDTHGLRDHRGFLVLVRKKGVELK